MIIAAADGSALGNPGPAGWAWYVDERTWAAGGWKHATNNQGELKAVLELFRATAHLDDELLVQCDSQYVINSVTKWMPGWKRKGWRKADGKPVMNVELLQQLDEVLAGRRYRFEWVKGHVGHPLNEAADSRARAVAEAYRSGLPIPSGPGWTGDGVAGADAVHERMLDEATAIDDEDDRGDRDADEVPATLFELDEAPDAWQTLTLELSTEEHDRLVQRARAAGVSPEEFLRGLI
ncbi:RNase H family protein [Agromyces italicus]|uniref:RNase H family protein n=1 Tax=Agromyces italicus TaxID=279572 RepID=UPI0003B4B353|nr:RNase H family protein [Agromyces italicus]